MFEVLIGLSLAFACGCGYLSVQSLKAGFCVGVQPARFMRLNLATDTLTTLFFSLGLLSLVAAKESPLNSFQWMFPSLFLVFTAGAFYFRGRALKEMATQPKVLSGDEDLNRLREGVLEFAEGLVRDAAVPINDVFKVSAEDTLEEILNHESYRPYSRIPVYRGEKDNIVGIIYAKELLQAYQGNPAHSPRKTPIKPSIREAFFVPEVMEQTVLLQEFQKRKIQMAIIVDEYGVNAGIVTLEDLIETIVGDLQDRRNDDDNFVHSEGHREWVLDAMMELDDFSKLIDQKFESDIVDTLGGFVFQAIGFLPSVGDNLVLENLEFTVEELDGYRIRKIKVRELSS